MNAHKFSPDHSETLNVLVIDDERLSSHDLRIQLLFVGEKPVLCSSDQWSEVAAQGDGQLFAVLIGTIRNCERGELLAAVHARFPALGILLVTNQPAPDLTTLPPEGRAGVQLLDAAALNYEAMLTALRRVRERQGLAVQVPRSRILSPTGSALFRSLSGKSGVIQQVRRQVQQVSGRDVTVLVLGESGTGKEVVARNLHYHSGRGAGPFIAVNCATITPDRYGVELFGQSGGVPGLLERADGGTLYLDEIAELPVSIQTLLLRFLEDKCFHRSGDGELLQADVRVVAGSAQNLQQLMQRGQFRADLYYRLTLMPIVLPPLRNRLEDVPDLVQELLKNLESRGYEPVSLKPAVLEALQNCRWPGNVRELANLIERLCIMHGAAEVAVEDLPPEYRLVGDTEALLREIEALTSKVEEKVASSRGQAKPVTATERAEPARNAAQTRPGPGASLLVLDDDSLQKTLQHFEKELLVAALEDCANIVSFAAERLGLDEPELKLKMQAYALQGF